MKTLLAVLFCCCVAIALAQESVSNATISGTAETNESVNQTEAGNKSSESTVKAETSSHVDKSTTVKAEASSQADNSTVVADNSTVVADNSTVVTDNSTVADNSTVEPTNSTSSPTMAPTTPVPTTPVPPTPQIPPAHDWDLHYNDSTNATCLKLSLGARFTFRDGNASQVSVLFPNATIDYTRSHCEHAKDSTQVILLKWDDVMAGFTFNKTDKKYSLIAIALYYKSDSFLIDTSADTLTAGVGNSYKCNKEQTFHNENSTLVVDLESVQIQAYTNGNNVFGTAEDCASGTSDIVPIAVGCALAGLVIIVLIAYLVGRRKNRQKGYQSV